MRQVQRGLRSESLSDQTAQMLKKMKSHEAGWQLGGTRERTV